MKRRAWKAVLAAGGAALLSVGGLVLDGHRRAEALLDREREAVRSEVAGYRKRDASRPSASPDPMDGNAWDYYGPAVAAFRAMPAELADLFPQLSGEDPAGDIPPDDHALHNLILHYRPEMDRLRQGARCRIVLLRQMMLNDDDVLPIPDVVRTCKVLAGVVAHEHRMGRDEEALRAAVLGLALAQDFGRGGLVINAVVQEVGEGVVFAELKRMFAEGSTAPTLLADFAGTLDRLDRSRPEFMDSLQGERTVLKRAILETPWEGLFPRSFTLGSTTRTPYPRPGWRTLFSERIARAQAVVQLEECFRQIGGLRAMPAWERIAAAEAIDRKHHPSGAPGNPLLQAGLPSFGRAFRRDAVGRLQRTLLRLSVAICRFQADQGRLPTSLGDLVPMYVREIPRCPLTGLPLVYREGRVWSVGKNGVDDGGIEDPEDTESDGGDHADVVWAVRARK